VPVALAELPLFEPLAVDDPDPEPGSKTVRVDVADEDPAEATDEGTGTIEPAMGTGISNAVAAQGVVFVVLETEGSVGTGADEWADCWEMEDEGCVLSPGGTGMGTEPMNVGCRDEVVWTIAEPARGADSMGGGASVT